MIYRTLNSAARGNKSRMMPHTIPLMRSILFSLSDATLMLNSNEFEFSSELGRGGRIFAELWSSGQLLMGAQKNTQNKRPPPL